MQPVTTLWSGKKVVNEDIKKDKHLASLDPINAQSNEDKDSTHNAKKDKDAEAQPYKPVAPVPNHLISPKQITQNQEILGIFKEVEINILFLDSIKQIPSYAKILKDLFTIKHRMHEEKKAFLTEQVGAIINHNTTPKYKDPRCPTISCVIGNFQIEQALLDLGAHVNLLPYLVFE